MSRVEWSWVECVWGGGGGREVKSSVRVCAVVYESGVRVLCVSSRTLLTGFSSVITLAERCS